jgi:hypothetical protein
VTAATIVVLVYGAFVLAASGWALWFTRPYVPPASALDEPAAHADSCPDCNGWLVAEMTCQTCLHEQYMPASAITFTRTGDRLLITAACPSCGARMAGPAPLGAASFLAAHGVADGDAIAARLAEELDQHGRPM